MPTPVVYPGAMGFLGLAKETTQGTAVAPTRYLPYTTFDPQANPALLVDQGQRGAMASEYGAVMGKNTSSASLAGVPFSDTIGDLIYNVFGGYAVSGAGPFTHTFSLLNSGQGQPPSHTFEDRQGITASTGARDYPGMCISELTLSGTAEDLLQYTANMTGWPTAAAALAPTNTPTTTTVTPGWRSTVTLGATPVPSVMSWSLTFTRELQVANAADGTQNPFVIGRGALTVSGQLTVVASDQAPLSAEVPLTTLIAGTQQALVIAVASNYAGTAGHSLTFTATKTQFESVAQQRNTLLGWQINFRCLANSTDVGASGGLAPVKPVLVNAVTTY
jgi:hypothetical protein